MFTVCSLLLVSLSSKYSSMKLLLAVAQVFLRTASSLLESPSLVWYVGGNWNGSHVMWHKIVKPNYIKEINCKKLAVCLCSIRNYNTLCLARNPVLIK